jgi:EAL domain-containing protein (putative c-di-GMP-specific phosphodiesterase class I)
LPDNKKHRSIVRALKNVCKELDITCMAEGVEKIKTLNYLRRIGIRYAQGFLFARPLKFEKVVADLKL